MEHEGQVMDERYEIPFDDDDEDTIEENEPAHVDFDLLDTNGRWFLKVLSGPNAGAEFTMQSGSSYLIGTDTATCDVVFQDLSVSRQHAKLVVDSQEAIAIEDLNSRNGTFIDGEKIIGRKALTSNTLITMGTTTFVVIDREGERATIVSPPLILPQDKQKEASGQEKPGEALEPIKEAVLPPIQTEIEKIKEEERRQARISHSVSALVILAAITGIFIVIGVGTTMLFKTEEIVHKETKAPDTIIAHALKDFPAVRYSFNPTTGKLFLVGHVLTDVDKSKIIDSLQDLTFINNIDYNNIIIDEYVWREINQVIGKHPAWKGVTVTSPNPGKFVISGFLRSKKQAEDLYDYVSQNFPYPDLLEKKVIVEEDLQDHVNQKLLDAGFRTITTALSNGQLILTGSIAHGTMPKFQKIMEEIKKIPGLRSVQSSVIEVPVREAMVNISNKYIVTGYSTLGDKRSVVINGRILSKGDTLDGMLITDVHPTSVFLEKDDIKYRIDFNR